MADSRNGTIIGDSGPYRRPPQEGFDQRLAALQAMIDQFDGQTPGTPTPRLAQQVDWSWVDKVARYEAPRGGRWPSTRPNGSTPPIFLRRPR